jgi:hypothetical protein
VNLGLHPETGYAFAEFVFIMRAFIRQLTSADMAVGVTLTVGDVGGWAPPAAPPAWGAALLEVADVTPLTYYALGADFRVVTDAVDMARAVGAPHAALPAGACAVFQEFGQPAGYGNASSTDGGSQAHQAQFFADFRAVLDAANATHPVVAASLYQMVDMAPADCEGLARYYNLTDHAFVEYLCTLGAVKADGTPKLGWQAFLEAFAPAT